MSQWSIILSSIESKMGSYLRPDIQITLIIQRGALGHRLQQPSKRVLRGYAGARRRNAQQMEGRRSLLVDIFRSMLAALASSDSIHSRTFSSSLKREAASPNKGSLQSYIKRLKTEDIQRSRTMKDKCQDARTMSKKKRQELGL